MCKIRNKFFLFSLTIIVLTLLLVCLPIGSAVFAAAEGRESNANETVYRDGGVSYTFVYANDGRTLKNVAGAEGKLTLPSPEKCNGTTDLPAALSYSIGAGAFAGAKVREVVVPEGVTSIGPNAFDGCLLLSSVIFEGDAALPSLSVSDGAFHDCDSLTAIEFPARLASVGSGVFDGCGSLRWVYFSSAVQGADVIPAGSEATAVFSSKAVYEQAVAGGTVGKDKATYLVKIEYRVEGEEPVVYEKLNGKKYNWERNGNLDSRDYNTWRENAEITDLPAQNERYLSTVWYREETYNTVGSLSYVNKLLQDEDGAPAVITLYARATVLPPELSRTVTSVYGKGKYNLENTEETASALGFTGNGSSFFVFSALTADGRSVLHVQDEGTYLITVSLDESCGVWKEQPMTSVTIVRDDSRTMQIMLVMLSILGLAAVVLSITLVLVRKGMAKKKRRRELTADEIIDRFIAEGGRTLLKK